MVQLTTSGIEASTASLALEVFSLLVADENFDVVEIALTVVAPRTLNKIVQIGPALLLARHFASGAMLRAIDGGGRECDGEDKLKLLGE